MDEVIEAIEKYQGLVPLVYDIETMVLDEARPQDMPYAVYLKREADKVIARHKYKRCLAMAMWCNACLYQFPSFGRPSKKEKWWSKWNDKWLAIAEKFKTNSTINRKEATNAL